MAGQAQGIAEVNSGKKEEGGGYSIVKREAGRENICIGGVKMKGWRKRKV